VGLRPAYRSFGAAYRGGNRPDGPFSEGVADGSSGHREDSILAMEEETDISGIYDLHICTDIWRMIARPDANGPLSRGAARSRAINGHRLIMPARRVSARSVSVHTVSVRSLSGSDGVLAHSRAADIRLTRLCFARVQIGSARTRSARMRPEGAACA
jgi:hypothetical protein